MPSTTSTIDRARVTRADLDHVDLVREVGRHDAAQAHELVPRRVFAHADDAVPATGPDPAEVPAVLAGAGLVRGDLSLPR